MPLTGLAKGLQHAAAMTGLALLAASVLAGPAAAQSQACRQLQADFARVQARLEASDPVGDAMRRQQGALARAEADHDRMCGVGLFSRPAAICPDLARRIVEMQTNMQRMQTRGGAARGPDPALVQQKARLAAALGANGCGTSDGGRGGYAVQGADGPVTYRPGPNGTTIRVAPAPRPEPQQQQASGGFFGALFGGLSQQPQRPAQPPPGLEDDPIGDDYGDEGGGSGAYRTLCVRTCDGYYFPISFSTSSSRFAVDSDLCHARCPASETRLFVHPTSAESETAVAADDPGMSYTSLPNALKYRTQVNHACTCGRPDPSLLPQGLEESGPRRNTTTLASTLSTIPLPPAKPRRDLDPDQAWNLAAGFAPGLDAVPEPAPAATAQGDRLRSNDRDVRVVGPKFFVAR